MSFTYRFPRPAVTVDTVVFNENAEVLLIKRGHEPFMGQWALPGGHLEEGESLSQAAARELLEETGIVAKDLHQMVAFGDPGRDPRGFYVSVGFWGTIDPDVCQLVKAGDDAAEARWFPVSEAQRMKLAFDHNRILVTAMSFAVVNGL